MDINLRKDSWHYKLQQQIIGPTHFEYFCAYFWLTIFCLFVSPFVFSFRWIIRAGPFLVRLCLPVLKALDAGTERVLSVMDSYICEPMMRHSLYDMEPRDIYRLYRGSRQYYRDNYEYLQDKPDYVIWGYLFHDYGGSAPSKVRKEDLKFELWRKQAGDQWASLIEEGKAELDKAMKAEAERDSRQRAARAEAERQRKIMLNTIVKYTKLITPVIVGSLVLALGYALFALLRAIPWLKIWQGLVSIFHAILNWHVIISFLIIIGSAVLITVCAFSLAKLITILSRKCNLNFLNFIPKFILHLPRYVILPCLGVANGVGAVLSFIWEYVKTVKKDYCPHISWVDE